MQPWDNNPTIKQHFNNIKDTSQNSRNQDILKGRAFNSSSDLLMHKDFLITPLSKIILQNFTYLQ